MYEYELRIPVMEDREVI